MTFVGSENSRLLVSEANVSTMLFLSTLHRSYTREAILAAEGDWRF